MPESETVNAPAANRRRRTVSVYFDGDGTLWDFQAVMHRAMAKTADELARLVPHLAGDHSVDALIADRDAVARELPAETNHERLRALGFARSLYRLGIDDASLVGHLTTFFLEHRFADIALYPDVVPCLERLRSTGIGVGLLSNGNTDPTRFGLGHLFDAVVFADDVGVPKPHARMYRAAEKALPADQYVMVGDDVVDDVKAPEQIGWSGIWLDRTPTSTLADSTPRLRLARLDDMPALLAREAGDDG